VVTAQEITDEESLRAWLEDQPHEVMVWIALRTAARVVPLWWEGFRQEPADEKRDLHALSLWRSLLSPASFAQAEEADLTSTLATVARAVAADAAADATADAAARAAADAAVGADAPADAAARAAADAAEDAATAAYATAYRTAARAAADDATAVAAATAARADAWAAVRADAMRVEAGWPAAPSPLWPEDNPLQDLWSELRTHIQTAPDADLWAFWVAWHDSLLAGRPMLSSHAEDHAMLTQIARADEVDWTEPQAANTAIKAIWESYKAKPLPPVEDKALQGVIDATPNAETIVYDDEAEAIRAIPDSDLPRDHLQDALDRLLDASEVFGTPDAFDNQYLALRADIEKLRRALDRYADRPLRLHDVSADLSARLDTRIANGECPETEKDALVASYKADLAGAMVDLQAHDPRVAEAVKARLTHNVDMVAAGDVEALAAGVTESAKITDEVLRFELREDLDTLKDHHATPEATRQAIYRLGSRLPRILWVYRKKAFVYFTGATAVGTGLEWSVSTIIRIFLGAG
jgi:hypothetical protein